MSYSWSEKHLVKLFCEIHPWMDRLIKPYKKRIPDSQMDSSGVSLHAKPESSRCVNLSSDPMGTKVGNSHSVHCSAPPEHTEPMQVPINSICSSEIEPDHMKKGKGTFPEDPVDNESIKGIFGWETVDDTSIPYILRRKKKFVSVRIVERKLLSKYPNTFPDELGKKDPLVSYFITEAEASLLNEINTAHCDFEYGHNPFTIKDLIVDLEEFEEFFKIVKKTFPADVLAKIGGDPTSPVKTELSQFCGWIQINNTVSPYILRLDNGKQVKLVPLSVIVYAAGLLTNSSVDGLLPTPQECAMLNEACKVAGFDFLFGKNTRLISISEVLHRCQVQLFELPFKNPLQHARYLDPCTGQPSSSPLLGFMSNPLSMTASVQHQSIPLMRPRGVMDLMAGSTVDLNPYLSGFPRPAFHPSQLAMSNALNVVSSGLTGFWEPTSPVRMRLTGPHTRMSMDPSSCSSPRSQMNTDKNLDSSSSVKQGFPGSLWAIMPKAPPPAHVNNAHNSMMSKTPPVTPDPPNSSVYQPQSLPTNSLLHSKSSPSLPDLNHPIFQGPVSTHHRSPVSQTVHKDLPTAIVRYPPPVTGLPLPPSHYSNPPCFPFGVNQFDSSLFARTDPKDMRSVGETHHMSSQSFTQKHASNESSKHLMHPSADFHRKTSNSGPYLDHSQNTVTKVTSPAPCNNNHQKPDLSQNISACLVNGKSISCINVDLPQRKGSFCLVEAVSKLYFPTVPLTEFVKVLQVVLKVNLHECTSQEETAFVHYYNLPVNKLKCNKIIRVGDLETYFPQLNYMFNKCTSDPALGQPALNLQSPSYAAAHKRRLSSQSPGPVAKVLSPEIKNVTHNLQKDSNNSQNGETTQGSNISSEAPVIVIDDE